jgi:hypothetical protein
MRTRAGWLGLGLLAVLLVFASTSEAYFLDSARRFDVRLRAYSQLGVMMEESETPTPEDRARVLSFLPPTATRQQRRAIVRTITPPRYDLGDLGQHRNFYNPEFDANLTDFMRWSGADQFKFRFAWWGFYDGLYDYLDPRWARRAGSHRTRFAESDYPANESYDFNDSYKRARAIYGHRNRINELYVDYTNGPFFLRVGRQAISWGESDTIALLDVTNPFDLTLGAPGFFQDVDEARIPLWTVRSTLKLIDNWGPVSSVFGDVYVVPGPIDTTVSINPITAGVSPFNPDINDPHDNIVAQGAFASGFHTVLVDRLPSRTWGNTRWGARLTGVLLRDYTVQAWFFRTFNQAPVPFITNASAFGLTQQGRTTFVDQRGRRCNPATTDGPCVRKAPVVTLLERRLESVVGLASTWFSQPVNGILKWEIEYFIDELAVIPERNLNPRVQIPRALRAPNEQNRRNSIPTADYLRWVVGYDRNFFVRALNPSNSFILVMSYNSFFNLSEKGGKDYRNASPKLGRPQTRVGPLPGNPLCRGEQARSNVLCVQIDPHDYEDAYQYEGFLQTTVQTDYMHGKLSPRITVITDISGIFAFAPSLIYRINDNLLLSATYLAIESTGRKAGIGTFRGHDMLQLRVTAQLN